MSRSTQNDLQLVPTRNHCSDPTHSATSTTLASHALSMERLAADGICNGRIAQTSNRYSFFVSLVVVQINTIQH